MSKAHVSVGKWQNYKAYMRDYMREYRARKRDQAGNHRVKTDGHWQPLGPWTRRCSCGAVFETKHLAETLCGACR